MLTKLTQWFPPTDSQYDTITKVHNALEGIKKLPHYVLEIVSHDNILLKGIYYPGDAICVHGYSGHAEREWAFPGGVSCVQKEREKVAACAISDFEKGMV